MSGNERGITLIEILVALAIISVGLVGLLVVVPVAAVGVQDGNQMSVATFLAQQRLEQARNATWTQSADCLGRSASPSTAPSGTSCPSPLVAPNFADEPQVAGFTQYSRTIRIMDCGVGAGCSGVVDDGLRLVTVTVGYRPVTGSGVGAVDKTVALEWMVTRK